MLDLALAFRNANFGAAPELTLPTVTYGETYYYEGGNYGDVIFPDAPADQKVIDEFLGIKPPGENLAPSSVSVSVIDGTGSPAGTAAVASSLSALGYRIVPTSVTDEVGSVAETTVLYGAGQPRRGPKGPQLSFGHGRLGRGRAAGRSRRGGHRRHRPRGASPSETVRPELDEHPHVGPDSDHLDHLAAAAGARLESELQLQPGDGPYPLLRSTLVLVVT